MKAKESLEAYGDNVWLYGAVTKIAMEVAQTKFKLRKEVTDEQDVEYVTSHQALATLKFPRPINRGSMAQLPCTALNTGSEVRHMP